MKKYVVRLSREERELLKQLISSGKGPARMFTRAHVLLKADVGVKGPGWKDERISEALEVTVQTVERIRKQLVEEGFEAVLQRRKYRQKVSRRKIDGDVEAHLIALSCSEAPEGYSQWSLRLLAEKMVELGYIESISHEAIRRALKKNGSHSKESYITEIELSVLTRQCLNRRIPDKATLTREVTAWEQYRNAAQAKVDWRFTTADARIKLKRLYPTLSG